MTFSNIETQELEQVLLNRAVTIDSYNLQMSQGTGIKTYSINLIKTLKMLGANLYVFSDIKLHRNPILAEVLLFDREYHRHHQLDRVSSLLSLTRTSLRLVKYTSNLLLNRVGKLKTSQIKRVLPLQGYLGEIEGIDEIFSLEGCYDTSRLYNYYLRTTFKIKCPRKIDIWHRTYPLLPLNLETIRPGNNIATIHDVIPLKLPYLTRDHKIEYYQSLKSVIKKCKVITTVSQQSKQDLLDFYDIDPDKIHVTFQPVTPSSLSLAMDSLKPEDLQFQIDTVLSAYNISPFNYILCVGTIEPRKNLKNLLTAYLSLNSDMQLVIVGKKGWNWTDEISQLNDLSLQQINKIKIMNYASPELLEYLYRGACCLVFPSFYEGFGLPPVEAMLRNCPVIASSTSSLPEVCGDAALYINPYDVQDIQAKLSQLLQSPQQREHFIQLGRQQAQRFSLEAFALNLAKAYIPLL